MDASNDIALLEQSQVSPPHGSVTNKTIPLSFLDVPYLLANPIHLVFFYEFPYPNSHFINTIIPNLKHSLSITLQHFYPLASNLVVFPFTDSGTTPRIPEIRFLEGDSVSLTVAECTKDFDYLSGNHLRKANEFYPLVPKLGGTTKDSDTIQVPLLAIQVTLFPNRGICLGITNHHCVMDGNARVSFFKAWASITKDGDDMNFLASGSLPFFDRSVIKGNNGLGAIIWSKVAETSRIQESQPKHISGNNEKVRGTFIMSRDQINKLKKSVLAQRPTISRLSSFTIVCAHVWICLAKLNRAVGEEDEREQFIFPADCRSRLDPPIPTSYFGNCIAVCYAISNRDEIVGEDGFVKGVELIREVIVERSISADSIYEGWDLSLKDYHSTPAKAIIVAGSPKFDNYGTDFGWGKAKKCEIVSIDYGRVISLNRSGVSEEDIEIGLVLSKDEMDLFESIFRKELDKVL